MDKQESRWLCWRWPHEYLKIFGALALIGGVSLGLAWGAIEKPPNGREILMRMANSLSKAPNWSVTVHSAYDAVQPNGSKVEWNEVRTVTLSRPDRLRVEGERSDGARTLVVFNGKEITTFDESAKVYAQAPRPGSVDDAVVYFVHDLGMRLPLAVLMLSRLPAELQQRVQSVEYVEKTTTLDVPAYHIAGKTATVDFQLWIAEGDRPLPLRAVLTYKNVRGQPQFRAQFSDWNLNITPSDSLFAFTPPEGAKKIPFAAALAKVVPMRQGHADRKGGKQ
jgi:hypothetical protein